MSAYLKLLSLLSIILAFATIAVAQTITTTKIVDNGPDSQKLTFAILGDGYTEADQSKYKADIDQLVLNGVLAHDLYKDSRNAFNVYRVDLLSKDSGISSQTVRKNTALGMIYSGDWNRCWLEGSGNTDRLIDEALIGITKYPDYVLVIANEQGYGGCHPGGNRLYVTSGSGWEVVAHEYGHDIGNLFDEYWNSGAPAHDTSQIVNRLNCSTELDRSKVIWSQFLSAGLTIPPMTDVIPGIDPNNTVGMFPGCAYESSRIYRPSFTCRMRETNSLFCPVCRALMRRVVGPFLSSSAPPPNSQPSATYLNVAMKVTSGGGAQLLKMAEVTGAQMTDANSRSNFVFEVTQDDRVVGAGSLTQDPFVMRGFADPDHARGEMLQRSKSATITIRIPNIGITDATATKIGLRFYELHTNEGTFPETIEPAILEHLKSENLLFKKFEISPAKLRAAARDIGFRINQ